jgi:hypothetical protein
MPRVLSHTARDHICLATGLHEGFVGGWSRSKTAPVTPVPDPVMAELAEQLLIQAFDDGVASNQWVCT